MPMVPTLNGGAPSVRETVSSAPQAQIHIHPTENYERLMNTAMKTMNDGINSIEKAMEVADARYVKAQSDDIETQAINAINTALYDKDNGYFTKQGKNALDAYKDTSEGLKKTIEGLIGDADPRVREAVQSRLNQRLMSASTSMQRWYAGQAQEYNLSESSARVQSLIQDGSQNYANNDYWGKTMASVDQELSYISKLKGWSEEQLKIERDKIWNVAMASRFQTWSSDDPERALNNFRKDADSLDEKTKDALKLKLESRYASECANALIGTKALDEMNPNIKTGIEAFDNSDMKTKRMMLGLAKQLVAQDSRKAKTEVSKALENRVSEAFTTGYAEPFSPTDFSMFGSNAEEACKNANAQLRFASDTYNIQRMSLADAIEFAEQYKPVSGSPNYKEEYKHYSELQKIISNTFSDYKKDGIGKALQVGAFGFKPLTGDIKQDEGELKYRVSSAIEFQKQYGLEHPVIFSNSDMDRFVGLLGKQETFTDQAKILREYADVLGDQGIQILASQLKPRNAAYANAMAKINDVTEGENGATVGTKILEGNYYLNINKKLNLDPGVENEILNVFGSVDDPSSVFPIQSALNAEIEAAKCMYAYEKSRGRSINATDAVRKVVGNIGEINGKRVILSEGVDADDTLDFIRKYIGDVKANPEDKVFRIFNLKDKDSRFSKEEVLSQSSNLVVETYDKSNGKASYRILTRDGYLANIDGKMMIIEVPTMNQMRVNTNVIEDIDSFDKFYDSDKY